MKVLVTGASGFAGRHCVAEFKGQGHEVAAFSPHGPASGATADHWYGMDVRNVADLQRCVGEFKPDACVHLAALSFVPAAKADPERLMATNVGGTLNLLEVFRRIAPKARVLVVSSSHVYTPSADGSAVDENCALHPTSLYAASKAAADVLALSYAAEFGMEVMTARPTNHAGPGQSTNFVVPSLASQLKQMRDGQALPVLRVGNLDSERDFLDVRDVVRAYRLLIEKAPAGVPYNIGSGRLVGIRTILDELNRLAGVRPNLQVDPDRYRPTDKSPVLDTTQLQKHTGWAPEYELSRTLADVLDSM